MGPIVRSLREIAPAERQYAGGKGGTLSRLIQSGYPVPDGFVVFPGAFSADDLTEEAWDMVLDQLERLRWKNGKTAFAVRSSALAEDSAFASFAGEFETVLDVHTNEGVRASIYQVYHSRLAERVKAYSRAKGLDEQQRIAVVVQKLVRADISGILFTADPVTGSRLTMNGNYVYGFGEELVSGEVEPYVFTLARPGGEFEGSADLKRYAKSLFKLALKLEKELGSPQDIEWALMEGELYLLQSRPITNLLEYDPLKGEWNSSKTGDYLWVGSEVFPDVLTPATYSLWNSFQNFSIGGSSTTGTIGGRFYLNLTLTERMFKLIGKNQDYMDNYIELATGFKLREVTVPEIPVTNFQLIREMIPVMLRMLPKQILLMRKYKQIIGSNPEQCRILREKVFNQGHPHLLADLWDEEIFPLYWDLLQIQDKSNEDYFFPYISARQDLIDLLGVQEAESLLSTLAAGSGELSSIKPLLGIARLADGQISREEYALIAGHRPPRENELAHARLYEDPGWIDKRLQEYQSNPIDYQSMLEKRSKEYREAWSDFESAYPNQAPKIQRKLNKTMHAMEKRELIRSEFTRTLGVVRAWFLQSAKLTGLGENIFFLRIEEVKKLLCGDSSVTAEIKPRRETYQRQLELPRIPMVISGRFEPYTWANDPARRMDVFDAYAPLPDEQMTDTIIGFAGSAGRVEGLVRIIHNPKDSGSFEDGEILVASTTNVGWTPLFPRASAVVTDVGAPLSHAAIVARELGIPAVVGTGNATMRLENGCRVLVDGRRGTVKILDRNGRGAKDEI